MKTTTRRFKALFGGGLVLLLVLALAGHAAAGLVIRGSVAMPGQQLAEIAVNHNTDQVYVGAGFSSGQILTVVDATNPASPTIVTTIGGTSGVTVNPNTNRFYTANLFGGSVLVFNGATNALVTSVGIGACPGSFDIDVTTNLVYVVRQCGGGGAPLFADPLFVLDGTTLAIVGNNLGTGGVVGTVRVNSATGRAYVCASGVARIFGPAPGFAFLGAITGTPGECVRAINPVTNRLYTSTSSNTIVRDGTTETTVIATITGVFGQAAVNTNLNRIYVINQGAQTITVIDGATNKVIETFLLPTGIVPSGANVAVDSSKNRLYIAAFDVNNNSARILLVIDDSPSVLDHFKCYEAEGDAVNATVTLEDQFGVEPAVLVEEPELFCNPVDKNGEGIADPTAHLTGYEIEDEGEEVKRLVIVSNQFGEEQTLTVKEPKRLFVPSEKDGVLSPLNLDHFKCYKAKGDRVNVIVDLEDQFGLEPGVEVREPKLFCNPVAKTHDGEVTEIADPEAHLTCYKIKGGKEKRDVLVENQFDIQDLEVKKPELLCVPSEKLGFQVIEEDED